MRLFWLLGPELGDMARGVLCGWLYTLWWKGATIMMNDLFPRKRR